jgi:amino-acid N-acetyltransferase
VSVVVGPAAREDLLPKTLSLLGAYGLPPDGLEDHLWSTLVARESGRVVGSAGVALHGPHALLRSVAVDGGHSGGGLGRWLTREALDLARSRDASEAFLFTETAGAFFARLGFGPAGRPAVPEPVRGSVEFVSACPASARAMSADLRGDACR